MTVKTYQPNLVTVGFRGVPVTGFAPGTFIAAARNNDSWSINVGSGGDATRTKTGDKSGRVTLTLLAESESNATLDAFEKIDQASGTGLGPLLVKDLSGADVVVAGTAWIVKPPDQEKANEGSNREWVFETDNLEIVNAGIPNLP
jgi:hypothetical protein